ncbi:MAG: hypothetical protein JXQ23_03880, partial [Clostridia bacterium]|nr:hypothetical protein [Clostridia bacterium]
MPAADKSTKKLALSGIFLAVLMLLLYLYTIMPTNKLTLLMFSSFIIGFVLIETDIRYALIFYFSSVILTLILPVDKLSLMLYYSFFGIYGLVKYYIEKVKKRVIEIV